MERIFFIGIGGSGMKPLARLASKLGYHVSGLDKSLSVAQSIAFENEGIVCHKDHASVQFDAFDTIVYSSAIRYDHPALLAARSTQAKLREIEDQESSSGDKTTIEEIEILHRMEFLNRLVLRCSVRIGVAGTHGKTSTASMIGWALQELGYDPDIIVGGHPKYLDGGVRAGGGNVAVFETDESDGSFLVSNANVRLLLNVDRDHLDYYGTMEALEDSFERFAKQGEWTILHRGDPFLESCSFTMKEAGNHRFVSFQIHDQEQDLNEDPYQSAFLEGTDTVLFSRGEKLTLNVPGRHFAKNAMGAFTLIDSAIGEGILSKPEDYSRNRLLEILGRYPGVQRRVDQISKNNGIEIYDDYGHHPTELEAVFSALKMRYPERRLIVVFQPHRYTRTREHGASFARVLSQWADHTYLMPIYPAGEDPLQGVDSRSIMNSMTDSNGVELLEEESFDRVFEAVKTGDLVLFQGAGSISGMIREYLERLGWLDGE